MSSTAVISDRMPLIRVGVAASLRLVGITTVAYEEDLAEAVDAAVAAHAAVLVLGGAGEATADPLARLMGRLGSIRVVALVAEGDRRTLVALLEAGVDAVALQTIQPEDFGALVTRVLSGERTVDPDLMTVVVDLARDRSLPGGNGLLDAVVGGDAIGAPARRVPAGRGDGIPLTSKELQVLTRLAAGASNADIAAALFVSPATVKTHLAHIYAKLGVGSRHGATKRAVALGLVV